MCIHNYISKEINLSSIQKFKFIFTGTSRTPIVTWVSASYNNAQESSTYMVLVAAAKKKMLTKNPLKDARNTIKFIDFRAQNDL